MAEHDLISKTALLKHLDMAIECKDCPRNADKELYKCVNNPTSERCTCSDIAHICNTITDFETAADVQPVSQWISVKDRLPDENQKCLVYRNINTDLKITTGIWHSEWKAFDGLRHGTRLEDTIAWMPLPEPPKDGETEWQSTS